MTTADNLVTAAGYPSTPKIPRSVLRAVAAGPQADQHPAGPAHLRHRADPGADLFAGLTALTTWSCRLEHRRQAAPGVNTLPGEYTQIWSP